MYTVIVNKCSRDPRTYRNITHIHHRSTRESTVCKIRLLVQKEMKVHERRTRSNFDTLYTESRCRRFNFAADVSLFIISFVGDSEILQSTFDPFSQNALECYL